MAGRREGLAGQRSGLFMDQVRVVKEMRERDKSSGRSDEHIRPRYMVWENVPEHSAATKDRTSRRSSQKSSGSSNQMLPMSLCLRRGSGTSQELSWETASAWPGGFTMRSGLASHNDAKEYACWLTSTDLQQEKYCFTLSSSERPREDNHTRMSEILEKNADPKYHLSARACRGILNRSQKRGKELPEILKQALENQIAYEENNELMHSED